MIGKTISHYRVLEKLGEGGMGIVYKAEDTRLKRTVALKFLSPAAVGSAEEKTRFVHEAQAAAALDHPNICTVYEVDDCEGQAYIAMAYIDGQSLKEKIECGPLKLNEALDIAAQIALGLDKAHKQSIVHRDIKPANVMITQDGVAKIVDFGLAKLGRRTKLTQTGTTLGTAAYMSPEQARGEVVDHRTDIWSLGVVLYEMVTGQLPFQGDYEQAVIYSIVNEEPEPVTRLRPDLPSDIDEIVTRALAKDPQMRHQTTEEFLQELRALQSGTALPLGARVAPVRRLRFHTAKLAWPAGILVLLGVAALFLLRRPASPPAPPRHSQLTFLGDARLPAISPDGKFMAFTRGIVGSEEARNVFVQDIGVGRAVKVFEVDGGVRDIAWSPGGSELLVAVDDDGIYLVPRLGGTARRFPLRSAHVVWSPDGKRFATRTATSAITITNKTTGSSQVISLDSTLFAPPEGPMPSIGMDWSPRGDWLVFGHWEKGRAVLWTVNVSTRKLNRIVEDSSGVGRPRWSPKGDAVYYVRSGGGQTSELWKISVNPRSGRADGEPRFLLGGIPMGGISLARDGRRLLYVRSSFRSNLWLVKRGSSENTKARPQQITHGTVVDYELAVSPDGTRVAFARAIGETSHIFVVPIEGGEPRQLTFLHSVNTSPAWSPDGTKVAFIIELDGRHQIGIVNADGSDEHALPELQPTLHFLSWAPAERIVYLGQGRNRLHLLDPVSGKEARFPKEKPWPNRIGFGFFLSPDGRRLAFVSSDPNGKWSLIVASLETGEWTTVREKPGFVMGWRTDGAGLYVLERGTDLDSEEHARIVFISADSGKPASLATLPFGANEIGACAANPEGDALVCMVERSQSDLWLLENFDPER